MYACLAGVTAAAALAWLAPAAVACAALGLLGFALGPIFPTTMAIVPRLTRARLVPTAIGVLNAASVVGGALLPWLAGTMAQAAGMWVLLPFAIALAIAQFAIWRPIACLAEIARPGGRARRVRRSVQHYRGSGTAGGPGSGEPVETKLELPRQDCAAMVVGGPTTVLDLGGLRIVSDPTFDAPGPHGYLTKITGPAITEQQLGPVDLVLISHDNHPDNLDDRGRALALAAPLALTTTSGAGRLAGRPSAWPHGPAIACSVPAAAT